MKINEDWKINENEYECPICHKIFSKNGICSHIICAHTEEGRKRVEKNKKLNSRREPWNKGCTKETDERIAKIAETFKSKNHIPWNKGKKGIFSEETIKNISNKMKKIAKTRVSNKGSGRAYKGWYKNYWCDSQWELAFLIFCLDHSIEIKRCEEAFEYVYDNDIHLYHPDFIVNNNEYIEIKGYQTKKDDAKFFAFPKDKILKVYKREDMKEIFDYVLNEYNISKISDIHLLYDSCKKIKKHKDRKSKVNYIEIEKRINRIKNSNIDFSKFGWVQKVAILENISHTQVKRFMEVYMKDFYNICYNRKSPRMPLKG